VLETQTPITTAVAEGRITMRPENAADEDFLYALYASVREPELSVTGWNQAARTQFLQMQFRAMRQGYRSMFPQAACSIILAGDKPIGRLVVNRDQHEIRLVDIALLPAYRSQGIGGELLRALVAEARHAGQPVRLQVLKGSAAARLYGRLGFRRIGDADLYDQMEWRPRQDE
jgi:ribosomal protein S18 acetylase RimI-like enzyme